ncbi:MAG: TolC family protein [Verrucomicrobiae bacterium]|nr:TolC family protein [Verrucomicrobiae bacterium]
MKTRKAVLLLLPAVLAGCVGVQISAERQARNALHQLSAHFPATNDQPDLQKSLTDASLTNFVRFALLNQPRVRAAYFDWAAAVERITVARSLPDPQLMFESDIADTVMTVMPGFMQMIPGPGKLNAAARVAAAESQAKYHAFESAVLQTAFDVKRTYFELWLVEEKIKINRETLVLLANLEHSARAQNAVGKATLRDVYRAQTERDQLATELADLADSRQALLAQFKGALGLTREQPDPPVPAGFEPTPLDLNADDLLDTAFARNPRLRAMQAEVRLAEANIALAHKSKVPDFSLGLMADAKASPMMFRPLAGMTLPVWRDKIAAQIAAAQAEKHTAEARLTSEQIMLAVDFAMKSYEYREATRALALLQDRLLPRARQSLELARAGYRTGQIELAGLIDAERALLNFRLSEVEARARREIVLAELSLLIAGVPPPGAPVLAGPHDVSKRSPDRSGKSEP